MAKQLNISVLNLVPVREGSDATGAFKDMITLAKHVDGTSYQRYWISEHHNMVSIASSATRQLIQHILQNTEHIRAGSGGVMLPNHSPYIVAEEFGTLHAIFGDRLDLGLGRAPGTDMMTASAIRRNNHDGVFSFSDEIEELQRYLSNSGTSLIAYPGNNTHIPLYVLGSSTDSAHIAAKLGLPYAFAAHFAPAQMKDAFTIYEADFKPSKQLQHPYKMVSNNVSSLTLKNKQNILQQHTIKIFSACSEIIANCCSRLLIPWRASGHHVKMPFTVSSRCSS